MTDSEPLTRIDDFAPPPAVSPPMPPLTVRLSTLVRFLFGDRDAILTLAAHRQTVWLGLVFVVSAGFAREYDGEDLLHEPWHLLLPLVASLGTSFLLFSLVDGAAFCREVPPANFWSRYRAFLGLYWMTAPLAWLYAIPVERFLSAGDATSANLSFLGIVSLWRVPLITRVLSVLYQTSFLKLFFPVMLFADTLAVLLVSFVDVQIFAVMGGVRLTEAEGVLAGTKLAVLLLGVPSWFVWACGTFAMLAGKAPHWALHSLADAPSRPISRPIWSIAVVSVAIWAFVLPWTQPEQQLRWAVERDIRAGRIQAALATMSAHRRDEFPPHWDPPPRIGASLERRRILKIIPALSPDTAPWVRELFLDKLEAALGRNEFPMETLWVEADINEILDALNGQPEGFAILKRKREVLSTLQHWPELTTGEAKQKIDSILLRLVQPPEEASGDSKGRDWTVDRANTWHDYLSRLEEIGDRELMLKHHESRLRKVLDEPQFVPEHVLARVRKLVLAPKQ